MLAQIRNVFGIQIVIFSDFCKSSINKRRQAAFMHNSFVFRSKANRD